MRVWKKQPPVGTTINWSNPLTRGLEVAMFVDPAAPGYMRDLSRSRRALSADGTLALRYVPTLGMCVDVASAESVQTVSTYTAPASEATVAVGVVADSWSSPTTPRLIGSHDSFELDYDSVGADKIRNQLYVAGGADNPEHDVALTAGKPYNILASAVSGNGTSSRVFVNGRVIPRSRNTTGSTTPAAGTLQLGDSRGANDGIDGAVCYGLIWNRQLSNAESASFTANPWQIFKRSYNRVYTPPAIEAPESEPGPTAHYDLLVQRPWTKQPPINQSAIDYNNPLITVAMSANDSLRNAPALYLPGRTLGFSVNEFNSGERMTTIEGTDNITVVPGPGYGYAKNYGGTCAEHGVRAGTSGPDGDHFLLGVVRTHTDASTGTMYIAGIFDSSNHPELNLHLQDTLDANPGYNFNSRPATTQYRIDNDDNGMRDGKWHTLMGWRRGSTLYLCVDGGQIHSIAASGDALGTMVRGHVIGGHYRSSLDGEYDGDVALFMYGAGTITDSLGRSISANPWQIFKPKTVLVYGPTVDRHELVQRVPWTTQPPWQQAKLDG